MQSATWNTNSTYEFKIIWNTTKTWVFVNGSKKAELPFSGQTEFFKYLFLGTDNIYTGQPGPIYSNLRIYSSINGGGGVMSQQTIAFTDITASSHTRGNSNLGYTHGSSWADINKDGFYDLFVSDASELIKTPDMLFMNLGNQVFQNEIASRGIVYSGSTLSIVCFDFDLDGDLDAMFSNMPVQGDNSLGIDRLYRNDGNGYFTDMTEWAGLLPYTSWSKAMMAIDIENDGDLDIYVNNWQMPNQLFVNNGLGQFTLDDTRGCIGPLDDTSSKHASTAADVDNDGDIDIFVARREARNWLFINDGTGHFTEQGVARGIAKDGLRSHGCSFVDIDNDGDLDLFVANFGFPSKPLPLLGVFINDGTGYFTDKTLQYNIQASAYSPSFGDVDNDGDQDLYLVKNDEKEPGARPKLYLNDGKGNLTPVSVPGLEIPALDARSASYADMDNDGDIDFYVACSDGPAFMLRNDTHNTNNYINVLCIGPKGDYGGFGTKVYVYENGQLGDLSHLVGFQESVTTTAYLVQNQTALHFGLGTRTACDIRIIRTDGKIFDYQNVSANQNFEMNAGIPHIVSGSLPTGHVGVAYSTTLQANGGTTPYHWGIQTGELPPGLGIDGNTGVVSGTPGSDGTFSFTVEVTDGSTPQNIVTKEFEIQIIPIPELVINTTSLPGGIVGDPYVMTLQGTGGVSPYTWSISSNSLPQGLILNNSSGVIAGTPNLEGVFSFSVTLADNRFPSHEVTKTFELEIVAHPFLDEEFITGSYYGYTPFIPATGPALTLTSRPDWFRITIPSSSIFNHWTNLDQAPQLRRHLSNGAGNWQVETRLDLTAVPNSSFQAGLIVYYSRYDLFYWGFEGKTSTLKCSRTGYGGLITVSYSGGRIVDLRIRKEGTTYYFEYKTPTGTQWNIAGSRISSTVPLDIGVIAKTSQKVAVTADFDFLRFQYESVRIITENLPNGYVGNSYSVSIQADKGTPPYDWNLLSGFLPHGLTLDEKTGEINGTPTQAGSWDISIEVRDSQTPHSSTTKSFTVKILTVDPLEILTLTLPNGLVDVPYDQTFLARGGIPPYHWSIVTGSLPVGLTLNSDTGQITGTPTQADAYTFTIQVTDNHVPLGSTSQSLTTTISIVLVIDEEFTTGSFVGYTKYIPVTGPSINLTDHHEWLRMYTPATKKFNHWTNLDEAPQLRRSVPPGDWQIEALVDLIYFKGTSFQTGLMIYFSRYDIIYWGFYREKNVLNMSKSGSSTLISANYNGGRQVELRIRKVGTTYYFDYRKPGDPSWIQAGVKSFTATPTQVGTLIKTWDKVEVITDFDYLRLNNDQLILSSTSFPSGLTGVPYTSQANAQGGTQPYSWQIVSGSLPPGINLNGSTGELNGTPLSVGIFYFTMQVTDASSPIRVATRALSIQITDAGMLHIVNTNMADGMIGIPYNEQLIAIGGLAPYTWSLSSGALPSGLLFDSTTGIISGTPTATGIVNFTARVNDNASPQAIDTRDLSITINDQPPVDEEFTTGSFFGYTVYLPVNGPDVNMTSRPGWLRFHLPPSSSYDHWTSVDRAPQIRRNVPYANWLVETRGELYYTTGSSYQTALIVYFSQYDIYYWGFRTNTSTLELSRTGSRNLINLQYKGGAKVDLRIRKIGTTYYFEYKSPTSTKWLAGGHTTETTVPTQVGLLVKTWKSITFTADFDYLRLVEITNPAVSQDSLGTDPEEQGTKYVEIPDTYSLSQNYPNPFNPTTCAKLNLPEFQFTSVMIYNIRGEKVRTLIQNELDAGIHELIWDARNDSGMPVNSGIYFMQVQTGPLNETRKMLLVK
jgi:hypothetical protein